MALQCHLQVQTCTLEGRHPLHSRHNMQPMIYRSYQWHRLPLSLGETLHLCLRRFRCQAPPQGQPHRKCLNHLRHVRAQVPPCLQLKSRVDLHHQYLMAQVCLRRDPFRREGPLSHPRRCQPPQLAAQAAKMPSQPQLPKHHLPLHVLHRLLRMELGLSARCPRRLLHHPTSHLQQLQREGLHQRQSPRRLWGRSLRRSPRQSQPHSRPQSQRPQSQRLPNLLLSSQSRLRRARSQLEVVRCRQPRNHPHLRGFPQLRRQPLQCNRLERSHSQPHPHCHRH
mmetsp:Transcript_3690/g.8076  ORF Transcript_3690/g.8076 Transcript_3690/m.8076 type:complete len:281 (-) Transcript_3690:29-871(-)